MWLARRSLNLEEGVFVFEEDHPVWDSLDTSGVSKQDDTTGEEFAKFLMKFLFEPTFGCLSCHTHLLSVKTSAGESPLETENGQYLSSHGGSTRI